MFLASVAVFVFVKNNFYCSENISENLSVLLKCKSKMTTINEQVRDFA